MEILDKKRTEVYISHSEKDTYELGVSLGKIVHAGDVITLTGDLGVGKTVFTKGLAFGLGVKEVISSPTFTLVQEYHSGRLPLYHFDVYRVADSAEMEEAGFNEYVYDGGGVSVIEWAELISDILPAHRRKIRIEKDLSKEDFGYRKITIEKI